MFNSSSSLSAVAQGKLPRKKLPAAASTVTEFPLPTESAPEPPKKRKKNMTTQHIVAYHLQPREVGCATNDDARLDQAFWVTTFPCQAASDETESITLQDQLLLAILLGRMRDIF